MCDFLLRKRENKVQMLTCMKWQTDSDLILSCWSGFMCTEKFWFWLMPGKEIDWSWELELLRTFQWNWVMMVLLMIFSFISASFDVVEKKTFRTEYFLILHFLGFFNIMSGFICWLFAVFADLHNSHEDASGLRDINNINEFKHLTMQRKAALWAFMQHRLVFRSCSFCRTFFQKVEDS